ncbi:rCG46353 [Rattus norvegicus]|uniref:RCG46353 n=1 Tax=Rattus norvegicus TaxID=10116 RepID=A6ICG4_RAT|nr:rCG46353 [Rattus norvegicus]
MSLEFTEAKKAAQGHPVCWQAEPNFTVFPPGNLDAVEELPHASHPPQSANPMGSSLPHRLSHRPKNQFSVSCILRANRMCLPAGGSCPHLLANIHGEIGHQKRADFCLSHIIRVRPCCSCLQTLLLFEDGTGFHCVQTPYCAGPFLRPWASSCRDSVVMGRSVRISLQDPT